jgi:hypothetical protein
VTVHAYTAGKLKRPQLVGHDEVLVGAWVRPAVLNELGYALGGRKRERTEVRSITRLADKPFADIAHVDGGVVIAADFDYEALVGTRRL